MTSTKLSRPLNSHSQGLKDIDFTFITESVWGRFNQVLKSDISGFPMQAVSPDQACVTELSKSP